MFSRIKVVAGLMAITAISASASVVPAGFDLLSGDTVTDIASVTGAVMALLGTVLVAKTVIGFIRR